MDHSENQPSLRTLIAVLGATAVIVALGVITSQYLLAALVTVFIIGAVIAWWILHRRP